MSVDSLYSVLVHGIADSFYRLIAGKVAMRTSKQIFIISIIVPSLMLSSSASMLAQTPAKPFVFAQLLQAPGEGGGQRKPEARPEAPKPQAPRPEAPRQEAPRAAPQPAPAAPRPVAPPPAAATAPGSACCTTAAR